MLLGRLQLYHYCKLILTFAPAPVFFLGFVHSVIYPALLCGTDYSMSAMWLLMTLAHLLPYIQWQEVRGCPQGCGCVK